MLPLMIFGPVVAPLIVAILVFIVIAAITGAMAASASLSTPVRVGLAFLIGGMAAAKAHSWAKGQVDAVMYGHQQYASTQMPMMQYTPVTSSAPVGSSGGLPPVNIPAHLLPQ